MARLRILRNSQITAFFTFPHYPLHTAALYNLKGGVGKTASCVNFAWLAAQQGLRTLVWDLDPQGAATFYFNTESQRGHTRKLVDQSLDVATAIRPTAYENLSILPADVSARKLDLLLAEQGGSKKQLSRLLEPVAAHYDVLFIDCPPGFSVLADNIFHLADAVLMPVIPTTLSVRTYQAVTEYFEEKEKWLHKLACFFTMADLRKRMHRDVMDQLFADKRFFEHYIPYLSDVEKMGTYAAPLPAFAPNSYAAICYAALWEEVKEGLL